MAHSAGLDCSRCRLGLGPPPTDLDIGAGKHNGVTNGGGGKVSLLGAASAGVLVDWCMCRCRHYVPGAGCGAQLRGPGPGRAGAAGQQAEQAGESVSVNRAGHQPPGQQCARGAIAGSCHLASPPPPPIRKYDSLRTSTRRPHLHRRKILNFCSRIFSRLRY